MICYGAVPEALPCTQDAFDGILPLLPDDYQQFGNAG